jgi:hypothetical protein
MGGWRILSLRYVRVTADKHLEGMGVILSRGKAPSINHHHRLAVRDIPDHSSPRVCAG